MRNSSPPQDPQLQHPTGSELHPTVELDSKSQAGSGPPSSAGRTKHHRKQERLQLATLCWTLFLAGWNDGSLGPLIPRIQQAYHVGYTILSLIFIFQNLGCLLGAMINISLTPKYGFGKVMSSPSCACSSCQVICYALQAAALPFPVFVLGGIINGAGVAVQDAQANAYVASIAENSETKMGFVQAAYGAGALIAPLVSTQFAQQRHWSFHYIISLGITALNTAFLAFVFRAKHQEDCLAQIGQTVGEKDRAPGDEGQSHFRQILSTKAVHLLALFLFVYVGTEVTIGGWIVSFMIAVRGGGPSAGYVSAGFFGGLTLGRILLLPLNKKIGERRAVYLYGLLAIALELVIWLVPSLVGGALCAALVGVVLGPIYPIAMNHAGRVFPPWLLTGSIGWIAGTATMGAAAVPFATGAIAARVGIKSLEPVVVTMLAVMLVLWTVVQAQAGRRI
ncbi:MFS general substrate transporter [Mycena pura]|uniref:MFS general substrate transporter n=1 Tax=Mycena pura TaxID=153505 RepID=A0AAD6UU58_9AGAR|nr:MFS general substrate transporter [Mycena pura]